MIIINIKEWTKREKETTMISGSHVKYVSLVVC